MPDAKRRTPGSEVGRQSVWPNPDPAGGSPGLPAEAPRPDSMILSLSARLMGPAGDHPRSHPDDRRKGILQGGRLPAVLIPSMFISGRGWKGN